MQARVAKLVDAADLKSVGPMCPRGGAVVQVRATGRVSVETGLRADAQVSDSGAEVLQFWHQSGTERLRLLMSQYADGGSR